MPLRPDPVLPFNCGSCGERLRHVRTELETDSGEPAHFYVCSSCGQVWTLDASGHFARARDQVFKPTRGGK
jgi:uncharacterized protein with PIN domain